MIFHTKLDKCQRILRLLLRKELQDNVKNELLPMSISHFEFRVKVFVKCPLSPLREHYFELSIWYTYMSFKSSFGALEDAGGS